MGISEIDISFLKKMYTKFKNTSEENIKIHVVTKFLEMIGYDSTEFYYEEPKYNRDGRADISVKVNGSEGEKSLYVEVKNSDKELTSKDISQLADYIFGKHLEWGLLTNGKKIILINIYIKGNAASGRDGNLDKVVFDIDIFNTRDKDKIQYLSKEFLYDTKLTDYFKHIAQYKALKFPETNRSWHVYRGTIEGFFKYYISGLKRYRELESIRVEEFEEYLLFKSKQAIERGATKSIKSMASYGANFSHIRNFFQELVVNNNEFNENRNLQLSRMNIEQTKSLESALLIDENIEKIISYLNSKKDSVRNKVLFFLSLSFGLERSVIHGLTLDLIKGHILSIDDRELVIPPKLLSLLEELISDLKKKKVKGNNLFYSYRNQTYNPLSENSINEFYKGITEMLNTERSLNPNYIRKSLIKKMYYCGYPVQEILYITGADLPSISNNISYEEMIAQYKFTKDIKKVHPFHKFLY